MSDEELCILRSGPGARVVRVSELAPEPGIESDNSQPPAEPFVNAMSAFKEMPRDEEFKLDRIQDTPPDPDL
ncbi:hypothetical protein DAETH_05840 [Deinococcus aetherius]|uniref:Uncharacterized protein n=1 Tax=Deinococcus aetherius TaxID=200252 RepID=A0ABN6RB82_9DEIO|nr:hypothetical protein [Deinococcus aetherius]BDP40615.1 hypothetical protein DAETH_05840 [Deinococcus aetherius]